MTELETAIFNAIAAASHWASNSGRDLTDEECEAIEKRVREEWAAGTTHSHKDRK